jgi:hypothetical protein
MLAMTPHLRNPSIRRDDMHFGRRLCESQTADSFDSRSVSCFGDRIQASTQKKFSDRKCGEQLDFASRGIACAMMPIVMLDNAARTNNTRVMSLFYRNKSRIADVIDM